MIDYIIAHKETFFVLCIMAFLGIVMFILSGMAQKDAAKRRSAGTMPPQSEGVKEKS